MTAALNTSPNRTKQPTQPGPGLEQAERVVAVCAPHRLAVVLGVHRTSPGPVVIDHAGRPTSRHGAATRALWRFVGDHIGCRVEHQQAPDDFTTTSYVHGWPPLIYGDTEGWVPLFTTTDPNRLPWADLSPATGSRHPTRHPSTPTWTGAGTPQGSK